MAGSGCEWWCVMSEKLGGKVVSTAGERWCRRVMAQGEVIGEEGKN